jgi:cytochrome c
MFLKPARLLGLTSLALASAAPALASKELAQANACLACHATDRKLVGPAFQEIAKRYGGQGDAQAVLARSIQAGGAGKWGPVPMPGQPQLAAADASALAAWVLNGGR